jgi:Zn-dependent protease
MALAGPVANLILGLLAMGLLLAGLHFGVFYLQPRPGSLLDIIAASPAIFGAFPPFLLMVMFINIILFAFNLLPIPPLDGFSVLPLVLPQRYHQTINTLTYDLNVQIAGMIIVWMFGGGLISPIVQLFMWVFTVGLRWVA